MLKNNLKLNFKDYKILLTFDNNEQKINDLLENRIPIYEPGLQDVLIRSKSRLTFTMDVEKAVKEMISNHEYSGSTT